MTLLLFPQKTEISNSYRNILTSNSHILYNLNKSLTVYCNQKNTEDFYSAISFSEKYFRLSLSPFQNPSEPLFY